MSFNLFMLSKEGPDKVKAIRIRLGFTVKIKNLLLCWAHNESNVLMLCVHAGHPSLKFWGGAKTLIECLDYSGEAPSKIYFNSLKRLVNSCGETRFMSEVAQFPSYVTAIHAVGPRIINPKRVGDVVLFNLKFP